MFWSRVKKYMLFWCCIVLFALSCIGCQLGQRGAHARSKVEFTVVKEADIPEELIKLIKEKKKTTMRLTYATGEYMYLVVGYGTQKTGGYSIQVEDVAVEGSVLVVDTNLVGPQPGESVNELPTMPYVVIKIEKREEPVEFKL